MKLYDMSKMVDIQMSSWTGSGYTPDWSIDFFEAGNLRHDETTDIYMVEDVDYCIEQAEDWRNAEGDFYEPDADPEEVANRRVDITAVELQKAEEVALRIRMADDWHEYDCRELCDLADMEKEWEEADGDTFEGVVQKAADKLGVDIW